MKVQRQSRREATLELVSGALGARSHLGALLERQRSDQSGRKLKLAGRFRRINGEVHSLLSLVAKDVLGANDSDLQEQLERRSVQREEIARQMAMLGRKLDIPAGWPGPRKLETFAKSLRSLWN